MIENASYIPTWFGASEFYSLLTVVWAFIALYLFSLLIRAGIVKLIIVGPVILYARWKEKKEDNNK